MNDLIEACSDALYEYEGKDVNVSKRTVQLDIQLMRSDKLGYNAPIEVYNKKYYRYTETKLAHITPVILVPHLYHNQQRYQQRNPKNAHSAQNNRDFFLLA